MDDKGNTIIKAKPRPGVKGVNRVLVTGGAGFVGSHLIDYLMDRGDHVMCLDNFFTGSKDNIQHHIGKPNFEAGLLLRRTRRLSQHHLYAPRATSLHTSPSSSPREHP